MFQHVFMIKATILLAGLALFACSKDDATNNPPFNDTDTYRGSFVSSAHTTSGTANVNEDETILTLAKFKTDSGPDLNIYLASDLADVEGDYVDLGDLKGVEGDYTYDLPGGLDYQHYKYVIVWCVAFHVNFGYATLAPL